MFPKLARVSNDKYEAVVNVERKGYITVAIARNPRATNLYWQLVDPVFSLLELGFEHPSGRLVKCAVPFFDGRLRISRRTLSLESLRGLHSLIWGRGPWMFLIRPHVGIVAVVPTNPVGEFHQILDHWCCYESQQGR